MSLVYILLHVVLQQTYEQLQMTNIPFICEL